jgi:chromate transporter
MEAGRRASAQTLFAVFARYANTTLGGGSATIAVLREQIVARRRWISEAQFELAYGLSRLTPGTNLLAFCTAVGWMTRRSVGAMTTLLASSLPCSVIAVVVTHFYAALEGNHVFRGAMRGALAAAVAVMVNTAWVLARPYALTARTKAVVLFAAALVGVRVVHLASFHVLLLAALVGFAWPSRSGEA